MTGTDLCVNKPHMSRSYLNQLVYRYVYVDLYVITSVWFIVYYFVPLYHVTHLPTVCKPNGGDWRKQFVVLQQYLRSDRYCGRDLFRLTVVFGNYLPYSSKLCLKNVASLYRVKLLVYFAWRVKMCSNGKWISNISYRCRVEFSHWKVRDLCSNVLLREEDFHHFACFYIKEIERKLTSKVTLYVGMLLVIKLCVSFRGMRAHTHTRTHAHARTHTPTFATCTICTLFSCFVSVPALVFGLLYSSF